MSESKVEVLKWSDIQSETMNIKEYIEHIKTKESTFSNFNEYEPKTEVLDQINEVLSDIDYKINILAIGADWCKDCSLNVPRMAKIIEKISNSKLDFQIIYGVMVNALRKKDGLYWHKEKSPPEATDPKFDLKAIPTFFIFIDGKYVSRVVEGPENFSKLEEELLNFLKSKP